VGLITGQYTASTVATVIFTQPPGPSVVTVTSDTASTSTAYLGAGTAVTSANGVPLVSGGAVSWATYKGSRGGPVSVITTASSAATVGWILSTDQ
jgi:hypothetical protein